MLASSIGEARLADANIQQRARRQLAFAIREHCRVPERWRTNPPCGRSRYRARL